MQKFNNSSYSFLIYFPQLLFENTTVHPEKNGICFALNGRCAKAVRLLKSHLAKRVAPIFVVKKSEIESIEILEGLIKNFKSVVRNLTFQKELILNLF